MGITVLLTKLFGKKAAAMIIFAIKDLAITATFTLITKLIFVANKKLDKMKRDKYYNNIKPEDDYVTVNTSLDRSRSWSKRKGARVLGTTSEEEGNKK